MKKIGCVYEALVGEHTYVINFNNNNKINYSSSACSTYRRMTGYEVYINVLRSDAVAIVFKLRKKLKIYEE